MKNTIKSPQLMFFLTLVLLFTAALPVNGFAAISPMSQEPALLIQPTPVVLETSTPTIETPKHKICGYISGPKLTTTSSEPQPQTKVVCFCEGIKVEITGIGLSALTDKNGYFEVNGVPEDNNGYNLKLSKPGYLTRVLSNIKVSKDTELGSLTQPVTMLAGDVNNDGTINIADILEVAIAFNSLYSEPKFNEAADLNYDKVINLIDVILTAVNFNKSSSVYKFPVVSNLNYTTMKPNDCTEIIFKEGGFTGLTWNYAISDERIIKFESKTPGKPQYPDAYADSIWIFRAISKGTAEIIFTPSQTGTVEKYIITVTDGTDVSPSPTASPGQEPPVVDSKDLKATLHDNT